MLIAAFMGIKPKEKGTPDDFFNMVAGMDHGVKIEKVKKNGG